MFRKILEDDTAAAVPQGKTALDLIGRDPPELQVLEVPLVVVEPQPTYEGIREITDHVLLPCGDLSLHDVPRSGETDLSHL